MNNHTAFVIRLAVILCLLFLPIRLTAGSTFYSQKQESQAVASGNYEQAIITFNKDVKAYVKLREKIEGKLPKLSKDSTPEQIQAHKTTFEEQVRAARTAAKPGDIFSSDIATHIRATIRDEFKGRERKELRETVLEADTKGVPLRVNYPYPETKELTQIPATLLLRLPALPKQVKYRFVGRHMLLVDRENGLILDYMLNALP
jgi:hypothetical protein